MSKKWLIPLVVLTLLAAGAACGESPPAVEAPPEVDPPVEEEIVQPTDTPIIPTDTPAPDPTDTPQPEPTDTPEPEPTDTPAPPGATRNDPAGIGEVLTISRDDWLDGASTIELELLRLVSGNDAWEMVQQANRFNDEPDEAKEYILALFRVIALEVEEEPLELTHAMFDAVSGTGVVYGDFISVAGLTPSWRVELYEGAEVEGWTYFLVDVDDTPVAAFDRGKDSQVWFALRSD